MFSGLVEEIGRIRSVSRHSGGVSIEVEARVVLDGIREGDSIAVNGVCLTANKTGSTWFKADIMPETARATTLGSLTAGQRVNLERPLRLGDRLGGHLVTGHVDARGALIKRRNEGNAVLLRFRAPSEVTDYLVPKGSVTVDGVSLTVVECDRDSFSVSIIPHTAEATTLGSLKPGQEVNLEADIIGKYVAKLLADRFGHSNGGTLAADV